MPPRGRPDSPPLGRRLRGAEGSNVRNGQMGRIFIHLPGATLGGSPLTQRDAAGGFDHDSRWSS